MVEQIVTHRNFIINLDFASVDNEFLGVTICSTTLSAMCYLYNTFVLYIVEQFIFKTYVCMLQKGCFFYKVLICFCFSFPVQMSLSTIGVRYPMCCLGYCQAGGCSLNCVLEEWPGHPSPLKFVHYPNVRLISSHLLLKLISNQSSSTDHLITSWESNFPQHKNIVDIPIDRSIVMSNFKIVNTIYFIDVTSQYFVYTILI